MAGPLVMIGIPSYGALSAQWVQAKQGLQTPLGSSTGETWELGPEDIATKRNNIAQTALNVGAKYVLFLGDDNLMPPHSIIQMLQRMKNNPDIKIITGVYFSRSNPPQPMLWRGYMEGSYYDWHVGEFFPIDWAGCDTMLVDTQVFRDMPRPWFSLDYVFGPEQAKPHQLSTEDIFFYEKAKAHGFQAYCDASIQCGHQDRSSGVMYALPNDWPQATAGSELPTHDDSYLVADLGAGLSSPYTHGRLVRFDADEITHPDVRCDLHSIPDVDQKYDEVHARHVLEHFPGAEAAFLIQEWSRILKIGGTLTVNVPNLKFAMESLLAHQPGQNNEYNWWQLYGQQAAPLDFHKNGFMPHTLESLIKYAWGVDPIHGVDKDGQVDDGVGCFDLDTCVAVEMNTGGQNIQVVATKIRHPRPAIIGPNGRNADTAWRTGVVQIPPPPDDGGPDIDPELASILAAAKSEAAPPMEASLDRQH